MVKMTVEQAAQMMVGRFYRWAGRKLPPISAAIEEARALQPLLRAEGYETIQRVMRYVWEVDEFWPIQFGNQSSLVTYFVKKFDKIRPKADGYAIAEQNREARLQREREGDKRYHPDHNPRAEAWFKSFATPLAPITPEEMEKRFGVS